MKIVLIFLFCLLHVAFAERKTSTRMYGSQDAKDGQFPYTTFLVVNSRRGMQTCTGSIVSDRWVLTAAHCVLPDTDPKNHLVAAGRANMANYVAMRHKKMPFLEDIDEKKFDLQERRAVAVYRHPQYIRLGSHDVGLVKVNRPFVMNDRVQLIPVSKAAFDSPQECTITGYGLTENNTRRYHLQYIADMPAKPARLCRFERFNDVICLGKTAKGICQGDSGGPLVCSGKVRGVASHGLSIGMATCGQGNIEQYYADTQKNGEWLNTVRNGTRIKSKSKSKRQQNKKKLIKLH